MTEAAQFAAAMSARRIAVLIEQARIDVSTETTAHRSVRALLEGAGLPVESEVRLDPKCRIDLMAGTVGIEVKVQGSRRAIYGQLERYAAFDQIGALVLATAAAWPGTMARVGGKPFFLASLSKGWL